jgi:hypothetical protein
MGAGIIGGFPVTLAIFIWLSPFRSLDGFLFALTLV